MLHIHTYIFIYKNIYHLPTHKYICVLHSKGDTEDRYFSRGDVGYSLLLGDKRLEIFANNEGTRNVLHK